MAEITTPTTPAPTPAPAPKTAPLIADAADAAKTTTDATARQAKDTAKVIGAASEKTAQAATQATQANSEILRNNVEAARTMTRSGLEAGVRSFEGITQNWTKALGLGGSHSPELAETSAANLRAVSQASSALARGAQEASRAWIELTQKTIRSNIEALSHLSEVRSLPELIVLQSNLVRDNLQQAIASGEEIARLSTDAIREATQAIQPRAAL